MGVLENLEAQDLELLLIELPRDDFNIWLLYRSGRIDVIAKEEAHFNAVVDGILNMEVSAPITARQNSCLGRLSSWLDPWAYARAFRHPTLDQFDRVFRRSKGNADSSPSEPHQLKSYANFARLMKFEEVLERELRRSRLDWSESTEPWSALIETGRSLWGERWAFFHLANLAAHAGNGTATVEPVRDILNGSVPLCDRVKFAASQKENVSWWRATLSRCGDPDYWIILVALSWMPLNSVLALCNELERLVSNLSTKQWKSLTAALKFFFQSSAVGGSRIIRRLLVSDLQQPLSGRLTSLLMLMSTQQVADKLSRHFIRSTPNWRDDPRNVEIAMFAGLDSARLGTLAWKPNLEWVEECYARDCCYPVRSFLPHRPSDEIKADLAIRIMKTPERYPEYLIRLAEEQCREYLPVSPVGNIALQEKWFEN